jgi:hypothetical protein
MRVCALFSLPLFALMLAVSPFVFVKGNWGAAVYPTATLAAAALYLENRARYRRHLLAAVSVALAVTLYLHAAAVIAWVPFPARSDTTAGWKELAARVASEQAAAPTPTFVLGCLYKSASELAYYMPGRPETYSRDLMAEAGLQYRFWTDKFAMVGRDAILIIDRREPGCWRREELCRPLERLEPLTVRRGAAEVTTFDLYRCRYAGIPEQMGSRTLVGPAAAVPTSAGAPAAAD